MRQPPEPAEWDAQSYHRLADPQFRWGLKVLERLPLRGDETVIDAGCGSGRLTALLLERLPRGRVLALDRSRNMLDLVREQLQPRFGDRLQILQADLNDLDLEQVADAVFSTATFHWVLDHPSLLRAIHKALRPGGWLVAQCGGGANIQRLQDRALSILWEPAYESWFAGWPGPWEFADEITMATRLEDAGFSEVETGLEPAPVRFQERQDFRDFLAPVIFRAHLERVPEGHLRSAFLDRMADQSAADTPPFEVDYWRLNLKGRRPPADSWRRPGSYFEL